MSKLTRKARAKELMERLEHGPHWGFAVFGHFDIPGLTCEQRVVIQDNFEKNYRIWANSWVLPVVCDLVPELRPVKVKS
jgi:hypothetical protein